MSLARTARIALVAATWTACAATPGAEPTTPPATVTAVVQPTTVVVQPTTVINANVVVNVPASAPGGPVAVTLGDGRSCSLANNQITCSGAAPWAVAAPPETQQLAGGGDQLCALSRDGTGGCWTPARGTEYARLALTRLTSIAVGAAFQCVSRYNGTVLCWGANEHGQLGDGTRVPHDEPALVQGITDVRALVAGAAHACALRQDATVWCWGDAARGRSRRGADERDVEVPAQVEGIGDAVSLRADATRTCAVRRDASEVCWGAAR